MSYQHLAIKCTHLHKPLWDVAENFKKANKDAKVTFDTYCAGINRQTEVEIKMDLLEGEVKAVLDCITERRRKMRESVKGNDDGRNDNQGKPA